MRRLLAAALLVSGLQAAVPLTIDQAIDVREPHEWEIGNLGPQGARLIPLAQVPARMSEIDPADEIVLQCRTGGRSGRALEFLRGQGYEKLWNLKGGILAWSDEVDPSIQKY